MENLLEFLEKQKKELVEFSAKVSYEEMGLLAKINRTISNVIKEMYRIKVNTVLYTKDGRKIGNAIVVSIDGEFCRVKTDYGNLAGFKIRVLEEYFYLEKDDETAEQKEYVSVTHKHNTNV